MEGEKAIDASEEEEEEQEKEEHAIEAYGWEGRGEEDATEAAAEEEEEEEEGEEYQLQFDEGTNPLDLVQEGVHGVELYQQFEQLEYEALAELKRKRKAHVLQPHRDDEQSKKARQEEFIGASMEEINELMNFGSRRRRSRASKKRGRKKGSRKKLSPEVTRKIGDATLHYASGNYEEAIPLLQEVVLLAPNLPDAYYILGLIHDCRGNRKLALNFHMIAAHLTPKDPSLWKKLVAWSIEQKDTGQVKYCLSKAITADPQDVGLRFDRALLYFELGEHQKAAESYEQILALYPANIEARMMAAKMYLECSQVDKAATILEEYVNDHHSEVDLGVIKLLIDIQVRSNAYAKALGHIDLANSVHGLERESQLYLKFKAVICHAYLGNVEKAEMLLENLLLDQAMHHGDLLTEAADAFANLGLFDRALKYYFVVEATASHDNGKLYLKIAQCYLFTKERGKAVPFFYKALSTMEDNVDARITLSSLLVEEGKEAEAVDLLSCPTSSEQISDINSSQSRPWWLSGKVKLQLAKIYHAKGMLVNFVDTIFSPIKETLEIMIQKMKRRQKKKLSRRVLSERAKLLDDQLTGNLFGFKPFAKSADLLKASRAKRSLQKKEALKKEKKAAALAAGLDWHSEDSEDEAAKVLQEPPLPGLLKDEEQYQLILDLCKSLTIMREYLKALNIISLALRSTISIEKKDVLRSLCAQIAYNTKDPDDGYNIARYIVQKNPYSTAAWSCYYKIVSRFENRFPKHLKFLHRMRVTYGDCVLPMIVNGHHFAMLKQHQVAAREYLEAYKLQPENPLISLCIGCALISLASGFRLQNKHLCLVQGFAFLHNYVRVCNDSQEAVYNVARAYHQVGLDTLAAQYYEKVLTMQVKDQAIPKLPYEEANVSEVQRPGHCSLHNEAAFNLHLIYKKSGAVDLARQVLKDYCRP